MSDNLLALLMFTVVIVNAIVMHMLGQWLTNRKKWKWEKRMRQKAVAPNPKHKITEETGDITCPVCGGDAHSSTDRFEGNLIDMRTNCWKCGYSYRWSAKDSLEHEEYPGAYVSYLKEQLDQKEPGSAVIVDENLRIALGIDRERLSRLEQENARLRIVLDTISDWEDKS